MDVGSGDLLSSKEYLLSGGDEKYIDKSLIGIDFDDVPVPNADLRIKNYSWVNNAQGTIGTINIDISNNSRFKYNSIKINLNFKTSQGSTLISKKVQIDGEIDSYREQVFSNVSIGYIDYDTENLEVYVVDANMIGYVKIIEKSKQKSPHKIKPNIPKEIFKPGSNLIVVDYKIKNFGSIKIFNRSNIEISDMEVKIKLFDEKNDLVKEYDIVINDTILPRQEKTFRTIKLNDVEIIDFIYAKIQINQAKKPKLTN